MIFVIRNLILIFTKVFITFSFPNAKSLGKILRLLPQWVVKIRMRLQIDIQPILCCYLSGCPTNLDCTNKKIVLAFLFHHSQPKVPTIVLFNIFHNDFVKLTHTSQNPWLKFSKTITIWGNGTYFKFRGSKYWNSKISWGLCLAKADQHYNKNRLKNQADFSFAASHKTLPSSFHLKVSNLSWWLHNVLN